MTTFNDIHNVIDDMYNARSEFRLAYISLTSGNRYTLETKITKAIVDSVGLNKIALELDLDAYSITILMKDEDIAIKTKSNVEIAIDGVLRAFLEEQCIHKPKQLEYLHNPSNKVMDIYIVGQAIKIIL